jgi:hypothetical protein
VTRTVLFTGSRDYTDEVMVGAIVVGLAWETNVVGEELIVVHGDARGADTLVSKAVARLRKLGFEHLVEQACPADWPRCAPDCPPTTSHRRFRTVPGGDGTVEETYCPTAGLRRNQEMLDIWSPDLCIAFTSKPLHQSRGTDHMVRLATAAHVPTHVISPGGTHR